MRFPPAVNNSGSNCQAEPCRVWSSSIRGEWNSVQSECVLHLLSRLSIKSWKKLFLSPSAFWFFESGWCFSYLLFTPVRHFAAFSLWHFSLVSYFISHLLFTWLIHAISSLRSQDIVTWWNRFETSVYCLINSVVSLIFSADSTLLYQCSVSPLLLTNRKLSLTCLNSWIYSNKCSLSYLDPHYPVYPPWRTDTRWYLVYTVFACLTNHSSSLSSVVLCFWCWLWIFETQMQINLWNLHHIAETRYMLNNTDVIRPNRLFFCMSRYVGSISICC